MSATIQPWALTWGLSLLSVIVGAILLRKRAGARNPRRLPYPPGPKGVFIFGNLFDLKGVNFGTLSYSNWAKKYGGMVYYRAMGQSILVLTSVEPCNDLLEKKSAIYSSRPSTNMLDLLDNGWNMAMQQYNPIYKRHRHALNEHFRPSTISKYRPIVRREVRDFLRRLLATPEDFKNHAKLSFASGILDISYGLHVASLDHPQVERGEILMRNLTDAAITGKWLVDFIPFLKYVPTWLPGAHFKRMAERTSRMKDELRKEPFDQMLAQLHSGERNESMAAEMYRNLPTDDDPHYAEELEMAKNICAIVYLAGSDTTISSVLVFILAMVLNPEVVKKAQEEIDRVIGRDRLPDFSDKEKLVYVSAIVKETTRWENVAPIAVPHRLTEDDEYKGYFIPKGTVVVASTWSVLHDAETYPEPLLFKPERFIKESRLDPDVQDPNVASFGFGRRICPGRFLAEESLWLNVAGLLATFNFLPPLGNVPVECKMTEGIASYPEEYKCRIVPRDARAVEFIVSLPSDRDL